MGRIIVLVTAALALLAFLAGRFLDSIHSPLTDFVRLLCLPVFTILFLLLLFAIPLRRLGSTALARNIVRTTRVAALLAMLGFLLAVFLPRSYGTLPMHARADIRYWQLPTGSHIGYTLIPAKGERQPWPIIYLQGGPGGSMGEGLIRMMKNFSADGFDVYVYDQIGSGWSDRLADIREYTAERHKKDLEAIVQEIGAEKVILIGQSWGAILATLYTADNPGRVAKLILTGPGPLQPLHPELAQQPSPDSLHLRAPYYSNHQGNERVSNLRTRAMAIIAMNFGRKLASDKEADDFAACLGSNVNWSTVCDTSLIDHSPARGGAGYYVQVMTMLSCRNLPDPRQKLSNSPIPLLVLKGQCDNQKWGYTNEYLQLFPRHRLIVVPDAGHGIYGEQPRLYLAAIRDFLSPGRTP